MSKRIIILTGAGAVIPWGAPSTDDLTQIIREDNVFINEKGYKIGEYIYSLLNDATKKENRLSPINFETILYFIELLHEYKSKINSRSGSFFTRNDLFTLKPTIIDELDHFEKLNPNFKPYPKTSNQKKCTIDTSFGVNRLILNEFFYSELYYHYITLIKDKLTKYESEYKNFTNLNNNFNFYLKALKGENNTLKIYTLNYDSLFSKISDIQFFDGYNDKSSEIDSKKIIESDQLDCFYHLHGSFELNLQGQKSDNFTNASIQRNFIQSDLIPSNIIAGYNKPERILNKHFYDYYQKFVEDVSSADELAIIGYSFSDLHVNSAIKRAINKGVIKISLIDKCSQKDMEYKFAKVSKANPSKEQMHLDGFEQYLSDLAHNKEIRRVIINESEQIKEIIKQTIIKFITDSKIEDFLTEDDLRCRLYSSLQIALQQYSRVGVHSEVRWYGHEGSNQKKLKYRTDLVVIDLDTLDNPIGQISSLIIPSKGYAFKDCYAIIELKLRRPNDTKSDSSYRQIIDNDCRKIKQIKQRTSTNNSPIAFVISIDKRRMIKEVWEISKNKRCILLIQK
jgi:NAD-dependent SIR2 family protein deacetylase